MRTNRIKVSPAAGVFLRSGECGESLYGAGSTANKMNIDRPETSALWQQ